MASGGGEFGPLYSAVERDNGEPADTDKAIEHLSQLRQSGQLGFLGTAALQALGGNQQPSSPELSPWPVSPSQMPTQTQGFSPRHPLEQIRMTNPALRAAMIPGYGTLLRGYQEDDEMIKGGINGRRR